MTPAWIGTSWKMNKTRAEAHAWVDRVVERLGPRGLPVQPFVIPPFTVLRDVVDRLDGTDLIVGAQNMHWAVAGAWTGEISPPMILDCGASLVEIGHSERRTHFGETNETVGKKTAAALAHGLIPLVCIGETADEKNAGQARSVLDRQLRTVLRSAGAEAHKVVLAYEPVWSIGEGGTPATPAYAAEMHAAIKAAAKAACGVDIRVLYGGSVSLENCAELIVAPSIDGLFVGRAAWSPDGYCSLVEACIGALEGASG